MNRYISKTLAKVAVGTLYILQTQHPIFKRCSVPDLERFVLQEYLSAPVHIRLVLGGLSVYINVLGFLLFLKPLPALTVKQVGTLMQLMDASPFGVFRAYSRFFFNIVTLGALAEEHYVS